MSTKQKSKYSARQDTPETLERNAGMELDLDRIQRIRINRSAVERRAATLAARRSVKKQWQAAWLLRAISCIDLTTLAGDDTPGNVARLCAKAKQPVRQDILMAFGLGEFPLSTAAICVYSNLVETAVNRLQGSTVSVAAVATGFPAGQVSLEQKIAQIQEAVRLGANEIDIVISRAHVITGDWQALYEEVRAYREACGPAHMKSILATGELPTLTHVARASHVCMMAGSDFIKTSTGKEPTNATLPVSLVMVRAIRDYYQQTGIKVGFKPAGGIRTAKQAIAWLVLIKEELGDDWLNSHLFRFGASGLLSDIERQLEHGLTGRYSAFYRHPMA